MHTAESRPGIHHVQIQRINQAVDEALQSGNVQALLALLTLAANEATIPLCDRVFRRVLEICADRAPKGWFCAWCDGSIKWPTPSPAMLSVDLKAKPKTCLSQLRGIPVPETIDRDSPPS